jgi:diguanylate cyclase (GGDEF)-like protein
MTGRGTQPRALDALRAVAALLALLAAAGWLLGADPARAGLLRPLAVLLGALGAGALLATAELVRRTTRRAEAELRAARDLALHDPLTGLPNRRQLDERLGQELARARRAGMPVALVVLDLDHFKRINDTLGHPVGDQVLRAAAHSLAGAVRPGDALGRVGGEEFVVVLYGAGAEEAMLVAERARAAVAAGSPRGIRVTCSAGVAVFPQDAPDAATLFDLADGALYLAKERGRDRVQRYDALGVATGSADEQRDDVLCVLREPYRLRAALQPVRALVDGAVVGHEALARIAHPNPRTPAAWFALAGRLGLGVRLEVLAIARALEHSRPAGGFLAVNASTATLASAELLEVLPDDLTGVVFEVAKVDARDEERLRDALRGMRARGARLAVDHPGDGLAGLRRLVELEPDVIKLDRAAVQGLAGDPAKAAVVEAVARLGARIGALVCAVGVEHEDELRALAELQVDLGQGHLLGGAEVRSLEAEPSGAARDPWPRRGP